MRRAVKRPFRITLKYGATSAPYSKSRPHIGTDYANIIPGVAQSVYAPERGTIKHTDQKKIGTGLWLYVDGKRKHTFGHLSRRHVGDNHTVRKGQKIATTGKTGWATGIHLHHVYYSRGKPADIEKALMEEKMHKGKTAKQHYNEAVIWKRKANARGKALDKALDKIKDLRNRPPKTVIKEVEKIIEKEVPTLPKWYKRVPQWISNLLKTLFRGKE